MGSAYPSDDYLANLCPPMANISPRAASRNVQIPRKGRYFECGTSVANSELFSATFALSSPQQQGFLT
jgi:hypothetical protein